MCTQPWVLSQNYRIKGMECCATKPVMSKNKRYPLPVKLSPNLRDLCQVPEGREGPHTFGVSHKQVPQLPSRGEEPSPENCGHSSPKLPRDVTGISLGMENLASSSSGLDLWLHRKLSRFQKALHRRNFLWVG